MVIRLTVAAVTSLTLIAVAYTQEGKPCPSGHICPICSEDNGVRTCKVDRPPQATARTVPLDVSPPQCGCASSVTAPTAGISIRAVCYPLALRRSRFV
jgi:hypothetical protein